MRFKLLNLICIVLHVCVLLKKKYFIFLVHQLIDLDLFYHFWLIHILSYIGCSTKRFNCLIDDCLYYAVIILKRCTLLYKCLKIHAVKNAYLYVGGIAT